ncbi:MAG TPA: outer membrane beta-barrel protein [Thermodesulfobacteriota bacterium]|nr:outer membrane beta-barrel protein [Thermodesulfobacteriota bacterium]
MTSGIKRKENMRIFAKLVGGIIVLSFVLVLSFPAQADSRNPSYLVLKGGIYSPQNDNLDNFDTGFNGEIGFGHYFNKNLALEVASGYFETRATRNASIEFSSAEATLDLNVVPLTLALKAIIPMGNFELYGIGGGGAYFLWTDSKVSTYAQSASSSDKYNQTLGGGFLGVGASVKISPTVFIGLEGKYLWTSALSINNIDTDINLNGFLATFNLGFLF